MKGHLLVHDEIVRARVALFHFVRPAEEMSGENEIVLRIAGDESDGARALQAIRAAMKVVGADATVVSQQHTKAATDVSRAYESTGQTLSRVFGQGSALIAKSAQTAKTASDLASRYASDLGKVGREGMAALITASDKYGLSLRELATQHGVAATSLARYRQEQDQGRRAAEQAAAASVKAATDQKRAQEEVAAAAKRSADEQVAAARRAAAEQVKAQEAVAAAVKKAQADLVQAQGRFRDAVGTVASQAGRALTAGLTVPLTAIAVGSIKAAADFEQGFANVKKTLGDVSKDAATNQRFFDGLAQSIRGMAKEIPQTTEQLSKIAALGGQFGISAQGIEIFTRTIADLGVAIDGMTVETAAEGLAQLRNITRESEPDISRLASVLVHLGNNGASSEAQILELSQRIAGAGKEIGLTTPQIMGIAAAVANVGINAEAGGTAISRTFTQMSAAVDTGGDKLEAFAKIAAAGNSALIKNSDDFARVFRTNTIAAIEAFVQGLKNSKDAGENLTLLMKEFGAEGVRQADTLRRTSAAATDLTRQIALANEAWQANNKHTKEAEEKYKTFSNQLVVFWSTLKDVGIELGISLLPALKALLDAARPLIDGLGQLAQAFADLPEPARLAMVALGVGAGSIGPLLLIAGQAIQASKAIYDLAAAYRALKAAQAGAVALDAATGVGTLANATGSLGTAASRALPLLGRAGLLGGIIALSVASVTAATDADSVGKKILATATPIGLFTVQLRESANAWRELWQSIQSSNPDAIAQIVGGAKRGTDEVRSILRDLETVAPVVRQHITEIATAFGRDVASNAGTLATVLTDQLAPGLRDVVDWLQRIAPQVPVLSEVLQGTKRLADLLGVDLTGAAKAAAGVVVDQLSPGLRVAIGLLPDLDTWRRWRESLALSAEIIRQIASMQGQLKPPPAFQAQPLAFPKLGTAEWDKEYGDLIATTDRLAATLKTGLTSAADQTKALAEQYASDLAKIGKAGFAAAMRDHDLYGISLEKVAAKHGIAETSLHRYQAELKKVPTTAKAAKDALAAIGGVAFQKDQQKAIEVATKLAAQIKAIGGTAKLTEDQQSTLNKAMQAGVDAMLAQGRAGDPLVRTFRSLIVEADKYSQALQNVKADIDKVAKSISDLAFAQRLARGENPFGTAQKGLAPPEPGPGGIGIVVKTDIDRMKEAEERLAKVKTHTDSWADSLQGVASAFADLAQIGGQGLDGITGQIANLIGLMSTGAQIGQQFRDAFSKRDSKGQIITGAGAGFDFSSLTGSQGTGAAIAGYANLAQTGVAAYGSMASATGNRSRGKNMAGGAAQGAAIGGSIVPGYGHAVGALVGLIVGAVRGGSLRDITARVKQNYGGTEISEDLSKAIRQTADDKFKKGRQEAEIYHTGDILQEAGGVKSQNVQAFSARVHDAYSMLETGKFSVEDTRKVVDENFGQLAAFYEKSGRVINKEMRDIIRLNKEMGTESEVVKDFVMRQAATLGDGLQRMLADKVKTYGGLKQQIEDAKTSLDEQKAESGGRELGVDDAVALNQAQAEYDALLAKQRQGAVETQAEFDRVGRLALRGITAAQKDGLSYDETLEQIGGSLSTLVQLQNDLGITTQNRVLQDLINEQALTEKYAERVDAVRALNDTAVALGNLDAFDAETFADMQQQAQAAKASMEEAGFSQESILRRMAPFLKTIREQHWENNFAIDEGTKSMIEQADAAGLLGGKTKTAAEETKAGFDNVSIGIAALIETMGGRVPEALKKVVDAANKSNAELQAGFDGTAVAVSAIVDATSHAEGTLVGYGATADGVAQAAKVSFESITAELDRMIASGELTAEQAEDIKAGMLQISGSSDDIGKTTSAIELLGSAGIISKDKVAQLKEQLTQQDETTRALGDVRTAVSQIGDSVRDAVERSAPYWQQLITDAERVERAVDGISFGHSPGGLKEIAPMLRDAARQMTEFRRHSVGQISDLQRVVDNFGWVGAPGAPGSEFVGSGGRAGDTFIIEGGIHASAIDTDGLRDLVEDDMGPLFLQALAKNRRGMLTAAREILGRA